VIRWRKVSVVARFEFLSTVRRPGYLITTFGMPLFIAAYAGLVGVGAYLGGLPSSAPGVYGIVDDARVLGLTGDMSAPDGRGLPDGLRDTLEDSGQGSALSVALASAAVLFRPFATDEEAREALSEGRLAGVFVLPGDYLDTGRVAFYSPEHPPPTAGDARQALGNLIRQALLAGRVDEVIARRIVDPVGSTDRLTVRRSGEVVPGRAWPMLRLAVPLLFMVLFLLSVLMTSGYLMQGTAVEKENKVVEVLLAAADPDEILAGKLLGLGSAGLVQIGLWLLMTLITGLGLAPLLWAARVEVPWHALLLALPFFVAGFLFFGGLILGTGSLGSNMREAQQLSMVWTLVAALPLMLLTVLVRDPHGGVAQVLSWVPFTSGPVLVLRASVGGSLRWWEVAGAFAVLVLSTWLALRLGARLFRLGLLSTSRPTLREILRQARLAG
jgi:ABC-2 type transport system permease protein